jgi:hypothetical protein
MGVCGELSRGSPTGASSFTTLSIQQFHHISNLLLAAISPASSPDIRRTPYR